MITIEKEIKYNRFCRPGYHEDAYTDGIQTTVRLFGIPVYRYTNIVKRVDDSTQPGTQDKKPNVSRYPDGTTIILYEPVAVLSRGANLLYEKDMSHVTAITKDAIREPTKWEVLKAAYYLWRHLSKGKGLSRNFFTNALAKFRAAPWKASHASQEKETTTAPEPSASHSDTECRPPHSGQTNSPHSRSIERNT